MDDLGELKEQLDDERPVSWDQMPDIALYMDQIISYMPRQLVGMTGDKLTPAMVNNYIKDGLLPRADGKKYGRDHIAYLTAICMLKQVIPVRDIRILLRDAMAHQDIETFYGQLQDELDRAMTQAGEKLDGDLDEDAVGALVMELAVSAYTQQQLCKRLIHILDDGNEPAEKESKKKREH